MSTESNGVVLITGGSRGIGFGTARVMGREGWKVAVTATSEENLAAASARLAQEGIEHHTVCFRIEDEDAWPGAVDGVERALGPLSAIVCNAGISPKNEHGRKVAFEDTDTALWRRTVDVNLMGVMYGFRAVTPRFMQRGGSMVAISSITGRVAMPLGSTYYTSTKAAVIGLVNAAAYDLGKYDIRVNTIAPGRIETDMVAEAGADFNRDLIENRWDQPPIALRRLGRPEEVGEAVAFLCSPRASYITGVCLDVTGGWHIG